MSNTEILLIISDIVILLLLICDTNQDRLIDTLQDFSIGIGKVVISIEKRLDKLEKGERKNGK